MAEKKVEEEGDKSEGVDAQREVGPSLKFEGSEKRVDDKSDDSEPSEDETVGGDGASAGEQGLAGSAAQLAASIEKRLKKKKKKPARKPRSCDNISSRMSPIAESPANK